MTGCLEDRVGIVTGGARGIGRQHALLLAAEGARVVVNDLHDARAVVDEIEEAGGRAVAGEGDVADWRTAQHLVDTATDRFGRLDVLVNNAGSGGDDLLGRMSEESFDAQVRANLKGTWCPMEAAVRHWQRERTEGRAVHASIVNTSSGGGLFGNPGQSAYGAAKAGVAALTLIAALELSRDGIRVNAIAPAARTPMSGEGGDSVVARAMRPPVEATDFDAWHPGNVSPLVAYLARRDCEVTGQVFHVRGGVIGLFQGWTIPEIEELDRRWTISELAEHVPTLVARGADRSQAGGAAYASLRASLQDDRLAR